MKKRFFTMVVLVTVAMLVLAACGGDGDAVNTGPKPAAAAEENPEPATQPGDTGDVDESDGGLLKAIISGLVKAAEMLSENEEAAAE